MALHSANAAGGKPYNTAGLLVSPWGGGGPRRYPGEIVSYFALQNYLISQSTLPCGKQLTLAFELVVKAVQRRWMRVVTKHAFIFSGPTGEPHIADVHGIQTIPTAKGINAFLYMFCRLHVTICLVSSFVNDFQLFVMTARWHSWSLVLSAMTAQQSLQETAGMQWSQATSSPAPQPVVHKYS